MIQKEYSHFDSFKPKSTAAPARKLLAPVLGDFDYIDDVDDEPAEPAVAQPAATPSATAAATAPASPPTKTRPRSFAEAVSPASKPSAPKRQTTTKTPSKLGAGASAIVPARAVRFFIAFSAFFFPTPHPTAAAYTTASVFPKNRTGYWVVDSGCTHHMTPFIDTDLPAHSPFSQPIDGISVENPVTATAQGHHTLTPIGGIPTPIGTVLGVPHLPCRLLSVTQLTADTVCTFTFFATTPAGVCGLLTFPNQPPLPLFYNNGFPILSVSQSPAAFVSAPTAEIVADSDSPLTAVESEHPPPTKQKTDNSVLEYLPFSSFSHNLLLLHLRMCHFSERIVRSTAKHTLGALPFHPKEHLDHCSDCVSGQAHHAPVPRKRSARDPRDPSLRLIHTDWFGPLPTPGPNGEIYAQVFLDDASGFAAVYFSRTKDVGADNLSSYSASLRELTNNKCSVHLIQADYERIYTHGAFAELCKSEGYLQRFSSPYAHGQNGRAERFWKNMETHVTSMLTYSQTPVRFWTHAVHTFVHHHNRMSNSISPITPYELLVGTRPDISKIRVFGCPTQAYLEKFDHNKFTDKCLTGINLGPDSSTKDGFFVYFPYLRTIRSTRHVTFDELWKHRREFYANPPAHQRISFSLADKPPSTRPIPSTSTPPATDPVATPPSSPPDTQSGVHDMSSAGIPSTQFFQPPIPPPDLQSTTKPPPPSLPPQTSLPVTPATAPVVAPPAPVVLPPAPVVPPAHPAPPVSLAPRRPLLPAPIGLTDSDSDGNTNAENSRIIPITILNDIYEISHISRRSMQDTGPARFLTHYLPSYNMTQAALDARLSLSTSPFRAHEIFPSQYNSANFDITWKPVFEPASNFLNPDGTHLPVYVEFITRERATRSVLAPDTTASLATALLTHISGAAAILPTLPVWAASSPSIFLSDMISAPRFPPRKLPVSPEFSFLPPNKTAFCFLSVTLPSGATPKTEKQALASVDARHWRFALDSEYQQLVDALTWELVPRNSAANVISGKWVFKIKRNPDGSIDRYKARWVARGFSQRHNVDFTEIFAPVIRYSSVRLLLSLSNALDLDLYGYDISNAFARADVDAHIHVEQPHGFVKQDSSGRPYVCRLKKGLYGTKQAARLWHETLKQRLHSDGWRRLESDPCIFTRTTEKYGRELLGVYVDDLIHCCESETAHSRLHSLLQSHFPTTTQNPLTWILGMQITRDRATRTLTLDQTQAILTFLSDCDMLDARALTSPMDPHSPMEIRHRGTCY